MTRLRSGGSSEAQRALLQLQRQYGNRHVQRVLKVARQTQEEEEELQAQREERDEEEVTPEVEAAINRKRGGGQALDSGTRAQMGSAFGADFSGVRVHTDGEADTLNRALGARAFTIGRDVFFRQGEYSPSTTAGQELLAHELTHVVQQGEDGVRRELTVSQPGDPLEREAQETASSVIEHMAMQRERGGEDEEAFADADSDGLHQQINRGELQKNDDDGGTSSAEGTQQNPYTSIDDMIKSYTLRVYDEDLVYNDRLFTARLVVIWDRIRWRGSTVWVPRRITTNNTQSRGLSVGGKAEATFAAGARETDPLRVRLLWTISVSTPDKAVHEVRNLGGELTASQKSELSAKATVPVEGVPVEAGASTGRSVGGSLNFSTTYDEKYSEGGTTAGMWFNWKSTAGGGIEVAAYDYSDYRNLESDDILKDLYGGWFEGDLDLSAESDIE